MMHTPMAIEGMFASSSYGRRLAGGTICLAVLFWTAAPVRGGVGEWPMPRHDNRLSGHAPGKASMTKAPVRAVTYEQGTGRAGWVFAEDLDGDNKAEILYPAFDGTRAVTPKGELKWTGPDAMPMLVADFDGNGTREVLFDGPILVDAATGKPLWKSDVKGVPRYRIHAGQFFKNSQAYQIALVSEHKGEHSAWVFDFAPGADKPAKTWGRAFNPAPEPDDCTSAAGFLRGNENPVLAIGVLGGLVVLDLSTGNEVFRFDWDVEGRKHPNCGEIVIADVLGDAQNEFILLNDIVSQQLAVVQYGGGVASMVWNEFLGLWPPQGMVTLHIPHNSVVDVDGDGARDIVVSVFRDRDWQLQVRDATTGAVKSTQDKLMVHDTIDMNGDGNHEILTTMEIRPTMRDVTGVIVTRGGGAEKNEISRLITSRLMFQPMFANPVGRGGRHVQDDVVVMGDCDQDGLMDFVYSDCSGRDSYNPQTHAAAGMNREGQFVGKGTWSVSQRRDLWLLALADLNGDGLADAIQVDRQGRFACASPKEENRELGAFQGQTDYRSSPVVANLDRDGRNEIVIPKAGEEIEALRWSAQSGKVEKLWNVSGKGFPAPRDMGPSAVIADVKPDARLEVLMAWMMPPQGETGVRAAAHDGRLRWRCTLPRPFWTYRWEPVNPVATGRFTGRANDDLYASARVYATGLPADISYLVHTEFGEIHWKTAGDDPANSYKALGSTGLPSVYDVNGDGKDDILIVNADLLCCLDGNTGKYLQEPKRLGDLFPAQKGVRSAHGSIIPIQVTGDDKPELLYVGGTGAFALLTLDRKPLWVVDPTANGQAAPVHPGLVDADGDGKVEIAMPVGNEFHCYDAMDGKLKWKLTGEDVGRTDVATADVDGDGKSEFLVCGGKDLIAVKASGSAGSILWRVEVGVGPASPVVANVDDDDDLEILASTRDGRLHVFDAAK